MPHPFVAAARMTLIVLGLSLLGTETLAEPPVADPLPEPLRLSHVLHEARSKRREIQSAKARALAAAQTPDRVSALPEPMIVGSLDHIPFSFMGADASFMFEQSFPMSGILDARARVARAEAKALASTAGATTLDVEIEAAGAFVMLVEARGMTRVTAGQLEIAKRILAVAVARLQGGRGSAAEAVRSEMDVEDLSAELFAVRAEERGASKMLLAAMGRPTTLLVPDAELALPQAEPMPGSVLVARARQERPELAAMRARAAGARGEVDVMESMYAPMGIARVGVAYTMAEGAGFMTSFGVSLPLWRTSLSAGVAEANQMVLMADSEIEAMQRMIEGEVTAERERVVAHRSRLVALRERILPLAEETIELTLASYVGGEAALVSVLEAARMLRELRMKQVVFEGRLALAWIRLGRATGTLSLESLALKGRP